MLQLSLVLGALPASSSIEDAPMEMGFLLLSGNSSVLMSSLDE